MRKTYTLNFWHHSHYLCHHTHCIDKITPTLFMTSLSPYVWHRLHYTRHHILTFWPQNTILRTSHLLYDKSCPLSVSSHQLYRCYHSQYMYDINSSIWETIYPLYFWHRTHYVWQHNPGCWLHHTRHMYDIICATVDVTSTPSHQATIFMNSHALQAWQHTSSIRQRTNCIFVITISPRISHPIFCDIIPTICVTSYALYITSYPILMLSHYSTYDNTNLTYETTSSMQFKIYTIPVTSQSLVCVITPTVLRASHTLFVSHHTRHRYSIFAL